MDMAVIKEHPVGFAIGGVVLFVIVYLLVSKKSSGSTGAGTAAAATAQANTQAQLSANQYNAAVQIASLNAGVQQSKTAAQLAAIKTLASASTKTAFNTNASKVSAVNSQFAYLTKLAGFQAKTAINGSNNAYKSVAATSSVYRNITNKKYKLGKAAIANVNDFNGSQNKAGLLESVTGNFGGGIANANSQTGANTASAMTPAAITGSISSAASSVIPALFG